jgi:2-dehydro-3-deoxygluconokinase
MEKDFRIAAIGECMVELARAGGDGSLYERRYGGDTLNTAVYLARLLSPRRGAIHYVTRLGDDAISQWMVDGWQSEAIDISLVQRVKGRLPGLYMIDTDEKGERSFTYWRSEAPVRQMFDTGDDPHFSALKDFDLIYVSGITFAILSGAGRERLAMLMADAKEAGRIVAYDTNYRPRLWANREEAALWTRRALASASVALPSRDDLNAIFASEDTAETWVVKVKAMGVSEVAVKDGGAPVWTTQGRIAIAKMEQPVDTTGAGDSFNAGYLAARVLGKDVPTSVDEAHALASRVVQFRGAVIPREAMADLIG